MLTDCYPLKAQFRPDEPVDLYIEFAHPAPAGLTLQYTVHALAETVQSGCEPVPPGAVSQTLRLPPLGADFQGYGVRLEVWRNDQLLAVGRTAFDTLLDYRAAPRYGFLSDFDAEKGADAADILHLLKLHINLVQFYDWMYRHEDLLPATDSYTDIMGKSSDLRVVRAKLAGCRAAGMRAMAYGAVYAASGDFFAAHPGWNLAYPDGTPITFIDRLYYMDIAPDSPWTAHILDQFRRAVAGLGFDGIHMDTYGSPKTAHHWRGAQLHPVRLADAFPALIAANSQGLKAVRPDACVIFNNVGNWPVDHTAPAPVDAVYVEVWDPLSRYLHIRQVILNAHKAGQGKPVILAAYLKPFRTIGPEAPGAEWACLYLTSAIFAHGAGHLLLGEERAVLTQGYYSDYSVLSPAFFERLRAWYDFAVRYLSVLYDPALVDVSDTHAYGDNIEYVFSGAAFSSDGAPGTVWTVIRESATTKVISFINLTGCQDDLWNAPKAAPQPGMIYHVDIQLPGPPHRVFRASPEVQGGEALPVPGALEQTPLGLRLKLAFAASDTWDLLVVQLEPNDGPER